MHKFFPKLLFLVFLGMFFNVPIACATEARDIVREAIDHWRGVSSVGEMTMIIHRPDWERSMSMQAWTQGNEKSLVRVTAPQKDRGNGTLMLDNTMWNYSPKVNRVIKVPSSMMGQAGWDPTFQTRTYHGPMTSSINIPIH